MNHLHSLRCIAVTALVFTACGPEQKKVEEKVEQKQTTPSSTDVVVVRKPVNIVKNNMLGTFRSTCDDGLQLAFIFKDDLYAKNYLLYEESECKNIKYVIQFGGHYAITSDDKSATAVRNLDTLLEFAGLTLYNSEDVTSFNQSKVLGYEDWVAGTRKSVIDMGFSMDGLNPKEMKTEKLYTSFKIDGDTLSISDFATDEASRPAAPTSKQIFQRIK